MAQRMAINFGSKYFLFFIMVIITFSITDKFNLNSLLPSFSFYSKTVDVIQLFCFVRQEYLSSFQELFWLFSSFLFVLPLLLPQYFLHGIFLCLISKQRKWFLFLVFHWAVVDRKETAENTPTSSMKKNMSDTNYINSNKIYLLVYLGG